MRDESVIRSHVFANCSRGAAKITGRQDVIQNKAERMSLKAIPCWFPDAADEWRQVGIIAEGVEKTVTTASG